MILTDVRLRKIKEVQRSLDTMVSRVIHSGSQKRLFVIAEGTLRNRIRVLGPDSRFSGLEHLIIGGVPPLTPKENDNGENDRS